MEGQPDSRAARDAATQGDLAPLSIAFGAALAAPDVRGARALVVDALDAGVATGVLYTDVVRPVLAALQGDGVAMRARLAAGIGEAVLADLVASLTPCRSAGAGRAAVLSCRAEGIEAVDGSVAMDYLEADGWAVDRLTADPVLDDVAGIARAGVELVVAVTAGPSDALRLARACTQLRRLADPPVIILCDFAARTEPRAASVALGADAVVHDPEELIRAAATRLPSSGHRRWGVRLSRTGGRLSVAPTGCLDATSASRLADVVLSRASTLTELVIDLRDLAAVEAPGLGALAALSRLPGLSGVPIAVVAGPEIRASLAGLDGAGGLTLTDTDPTAPRPASA